MVESDVEEKLLIETAQRDRRQFAVLYRCTSTGSTPTSHGGCRPVRTRRTSPPQSFSRRACARRLPRCSRSGRPRYVNYLGDEEGGDPMAAAYGSNYARRQHLKAKYDPDKLFHVNQNITPARREP